MYSPDDIFRAAHAIRPYLGALVTAAEAQAIDRQLDILIRQSSETNAAHKLLALLTEHDTTQEWIRLLLEEHHPVETILKIIRTYHPLPGNLGTIESPRYICPIASCHQDWYRRSVEQAIPKCPVHDVPLIRASKRE